NIIPGAGIVAGLTCVNPSAMGWQIPLLQQLYSTGVSVEGLTVGAGNWMKNISFKSRSINTIQRAINIAKANPTFSVIMLWIRARGVGHHSFEDSH
ncbi:hypothetical protein C7212DRAFT_169775, partial [Tuber magnatum]